MKLNLGFRRFRLRGLDKAGGEWILVCLVYNIKKTYFRITAKGGEPDAGLPFQLNTVIITHGRPDHIGGNTDGDGR